MTGAEFPYNCRTGTSAESIHVMRRYLLGVAAVCVMAGSEPALSEVLARKATPAGSVIARKVGEEARFIEISDWRTVELHQDLLAGDVLRTNALGQLAILFSDRT